MTGIEAIGDAVTGGVVGRAVEPRAGEGADGHSQETHCLNCGCELIGDYCHCCGQHAHVHRTIGAWWHDFLHSVLHLDGKFARTLPMLVWNPGQLTRRYATGERAKFVSPLALFLFSVFLMFALLSLLGAPTEIGTASTPGQDRAEALREIRAKRVETEDTLAGLNQQLAEARATRQETRDIELEIADAKRELAIEEQAYRLAVRLANAQQAREREQAAKDKAGGQASPTQTATAPQSQPQINILTETGWPPLDRAIAKAESNPSLLFYKVQANAYKFSWALIPISLPFVWMLFLHRRRYRQEYGAYDHLIFVTYSIAFMSIAAIVLTLLRPIGVGDAIIGTAMTVIPPVHLYRQLRGAYDLSRRSAAWRTVILLLSSLISLSLFFVLLVIAGVFG